jgi:hypothetical protein
MRRDLDVFYARRSWWNGLSFFTQSFEVKLYGLLD